MRLPALAPARNEVGRVAFRRGHARGGELFFSPRCFRCPRAYDHGARRSSTSRAPVAVLSYGYWQRQFGADRGVIGQTVDLQGRPFTVVGVAPRGFTGLEPGTPADIIVPLASWAAVMPGLPVASKPDMRWLRLLGRRKPGVSIEQVQADLAVRLSRVTQASTAKGKGAGAKAGGGPGAPADWATARSLYSTATNSDGRGRAGIVDRVFESCQSAARAGQRAAAGDRPANRAGCWPRPGSSANC